MGQYLFSKFVRWFVTIERIVFIVIQKGKKKLEEKEFILKQKSTKALKNLRRKK